MFDEFGSQAGSLDGCEEEQVGEKVIVHQSVVELLFQLPDFQEFFQLEFRQACLL